MRNFSIFAIYLIKCALLATYTNAEGMDDDANNTTNKEKETSSNLDIALLDPRKIVPNQQIPFPPFVPGPDSGLGGPGGVYFPHYPFTGPFVRPTGPSKPITTSFKPKRNSGYLGYCENDSDCDDGIATLLSCELHICKCPVGKYSARLGGVVITSSWSPLFNRCEARTGADCNINSGGITCLNEQSCNQLEDRPTGIGCCGDDCADDGMRLKINPILFITVMAATYILHS